MLRFALHLSVVLMAVVLGVSDTGSAAGAKGPPCTLSATKAPAILATPVAPAVTADQTVLANPPDLAAFRLASTLPPGGPHVRPTVTLGTAPTVRTVRMRVTAYCPCPICCGRRAAGITASGRPVSTDGGRFAAADLDVLPFGARVIVPGYAAGRPIPIRDTGAAIQGHRLDVFFRSHEVAKAWGVRWLDVQIVGR